MKIRARGVLALLITLLCPFCFAACNGAQGGGGSDGGNNTENGAAGGDNESGVADDGGGNGDNNGNNNGGGGESGENPAEKPTQSGASVLVAYFSATGNTKPIAEYAASHTGGTLYEIEAKAPYTAADLAYYTDCRADREQSDPTARPEISGGVEDMTKYDTVFIGYPIWHGQAPKIIYTFLESYDFSGKTIVPFCTSASSGLGSSAANLHPLAPDAVWKDGRRFAIGTDEAAIKTWIDGLGLETEEEISMIKVYCGDNVLDIGLEDNPSAKAFAEKLKEGDVSVVMDDYGDFEKVGSLGFSLVKSDAQITTSPGDVILYQGSSITIYYDANSWSFTRLGRIKGMTRESMLAFFGGEGKVTVTFSLK